MNWLNKLSDSPSVSQHGFGSSSCQYGLRQFAGADPGCRRIFHLLLQSKCQIHTRTMEGGAR
jgi:hypothetical protein